MFTLDEMIKAGELVEYTKRFFANDEELRIDDCDEFFAKILYTEKFRDNFMVSKIEFAFDSQKEDEVVIFMLEKFFSDMMKLYSLQEELTYEFYKSI